MADAPGHHRHTNRLAGETSPYLLQHAHNPVDWFPWGQDALARAALLDRPIFLSIGYAACHWCHVMERESFEDETTAAALNDGFVAIKVDREERPDLDQLYMGAVQAMTGGGGWPMSVFLTPEGRPFYGGTYFPDTPRHGLPSFRQVLEGVRAAWTTQRTELEQSAERMVDALVASQALAVADAGSVAPLPGPDVLDGATAGIVASFDRIHGGWGRAPKFPQPMTIEFLLRRHVATGDEAALDVALRSLSAMAAGGIHDQLGGGFHRYATDARWLVPHFEQMLYDNAQLARVYAHAWGLTGDPALLATMTGVLDYVLRELATPDGGFAASQDADTDGEEGATFTWTASEVRDLLGVEAALFSAAYGITDDGNWEGRTILSRVRDDPELAERFGLAVDEVGRRLGTSRSLLLGRRATRAQPARDDKVLAAWNGLAIAAFADAARSLTAAGDPLLADAAGRYREAATRAADAVLVNLLTADGRLRRSWRDGRASSDGVLEDYANLAEGLLALYEATFDERWFQVALGLVDVILAHFGHPDGGFYDTADDGEQLVVRPRDVQDNATPSGGSMAATVLLRLAALTGDDRYRTAAERAIVTLGPLPERHPTAFAQWLSALAAAHAPSTEVAIVGEPASDEARSLVAALDRGYHPFRVQAASATPETSAVPLLHDRAALGGRPTAYVCHKFACRLPVTGTAALEALLVGT